MKTARILVALELFRRGRLSVGQSAQLSNLTVAAFVYEVGKHDVPVIDYDEQDFRDELDWLSAP